MFEDGGTPKVNVCGRTLNEVKVFGGTPCLFMGRGGTPSELMVLGRTPRTGLSTVERQKKYKTYVENPVVGSELQLRRRKRNVGRKNMKSVVSYGRRDLQR